MASKRVKTDDPSSESINQVKKEVAKLEIELLSKKEDIRKKEDRYYLIKKSNVPYSNYNASIFSSKFKCSYKNYKKELRKEWENGRDKKVISLESELALTVIGYFVSLALVIASIIYNIKLIPILHIGVNACIYMILYELITLYISCSYFVVRPNKVNKRLLKKEIKADKIAYSVLETEMKAKQNLIDMYNIALIDPNIVFNDVKLRTLENLEMAYSDTLNNVLPKTSGGLYEAYSLALSQCKILLNLAKDNSSIVNEISKIFNIHIIEINNILEGKEYEYSEDVKSLIENFSEFLVKKIDKYYSLNKISLDNSINALNEEFKGDESYE